MTKTSLIPLLAVALASAPAFAADPVTNAAANGNVTAESANAMPKPPRAQRYCVEGVVTGTILSTRECHTRAEWLKMGVDPLKPNG